MNTRTALADFSIAVVSIQNSLNTLIDDISIRVQAMVNIDTYETRFLLEHEAQSFDRTHLVSDGNFFAIVFLKIAKAYIKGAPSGWVVRFSSITTCGVNR